MKRFFALLSLAALCYTATIYADAVDPIQQGNSNADRIAAQAQANITQQQQILAQRLQALSAAMQAQIPNTAVVVQQPVPTVQPAPIIAPTIKKAPPPVATTPNATGLTPPAKNNNSNQWNYGF